MTDLRQSLRDQARRRADAIQRLIDGQDAILLDPSASPDDRLAACIHGCRFAHYRDVALAEAAGVAADARIAEMNKWTI